MKKHLIIYIVALFLLSPAMTSGVYAQSKKKTTTKSKTKKKTTTTKQPVVTNDQIKGLQSERQKLQKDIKAQEQKLQRNQRDVKQRLQNLMVINSEIENHRRAIDTIRTALTRLDGSIANLNKELNQLNAELADRKAKYIKSMHYMHRNRNVQEKLLFIFSANNLRQMYRRMRFVREYASYQRAQGEMLKLKAQQVEEKQKELEAARDEKKTTLQRGVDEQHKLEGQQVEQQKVVKTLQNQQKTIQGILDQQRKKDQELNARIDKLIAEEVARARARAEAEAKRKAEEEARRKAEEKRKAEERAAEARRKVAASKTDAERKAAEAEVKKAESDIKKADIPTDFKFSSEDRKLSGNFEANRGRMPMPITGGYKIVSHYGQYNVEGLKGVTLDNKGINILGQAGAQARCIFDGEVSAVFSFGGTMVVMVRHGSYISVYCNLASVSVSRGQKVSTRQILGSLGSDHILQFQLRKETAKLNPESWLAR